MEMSRRNSGFLPSFLSGFDEELFNNRQNMKFSKVAVNIMERDEDYLVEMAMPGIKKEDIHIELDGNKLSIRGEAKEAKEKNERSEEHTSELQSRPHLVCRLLLEKKKYC